MKKKLLAVLLAATIPLSIMACKNTNNTDISKTPQSQEDEETSELDTLGEIEVDENLFSVELTIPADYVGETTQEELNQTADEAGFKSITLHEDGSATYIMTKKQHEKLMKDMAVEINTALDEMISSEDYNFTDVEANDDFSSFKITTTSTELNLSESFSVLTFYIYGSMYHIFNGTTIDNIHVDFINADTGEIISSADSSEME